VLLRDRWRGYSKARRVELYNRCSLYTLTILLPLSMLPKEIELLHRQAAVVALVAATLLNAGLSVPLLWAAHAAHRGTGPLPVRLLFTHAATSQLGIWLTALLAPHEGRPTFGMAFVPIVQLMSWMVGPAIALRPLPMALWSVPMLLLAVPPLAIASHSLATGCWTVLGSLLGLAIGAASCRCSAWMVQVTLDLERAQEDRARLAVAEERLRFSRDLHDVLGRNLTTMALKAELAVQLARRGRPEAADQMVEVQRIAQQSHREVREVVRGYRTADLAAEVAGARSVLRAAGIDCAVDLGPDPAELPPLVQSVLGWVVREAATNVLRHSEAGLVSVRLHGDAERTVLELVNDGVRAEPAGHVPGSGLAGLRERLAAHGGELTGERTGDDRFTLRASLPQSRTRELV
jgi:two-component system sensor histidine kinase DesK